MAFDMLVQFGVMCFPLSVVVLFFGVDRQGWISYLLFIFALSLWLLGYWALRNAIKVGKAETQYKTKMELHEIEKWKVQMDILVDIRDDLKKSIDSLVNEIRLDRKERNGNQNRNH